MKKEKYIAVIGIGKMGQALVERLDSQGYSVIAFNRTEKKNKLSSSVLYTNSISDVVKYAKVIFISLTDDKAIKSVFFNKIENESDSKSKSLLIDTSTHSPASAFELSNYFNSYNISYIDAPVSGGPESAKHGTLSIMVGGNRSDYKRAIPFLKLFGDNITYMGAVGSGQSVKLVNQILVGIGQIATAEAMMFADMHNLDMKKVIKVVEASAGSSYIFSRSAPQMNNLKFQQGFQTNLIAKDLRFANDSIKNEGLSFNLISQAKKILSQHSKSGYESVDAASIILKYKELIESSNSRKNDVE